MGRPGNVAGAPLIGHLAELIGPRAALAAIPALAMGISIAAVFSRLFATVQYEGRRAEVVPVPGLGRPPQPGLYRGCARLVRRPAIWITR